MLPSFDWFTHFFRQKKREKPKNLDTHQTHNTHTHKHQQAPTSTNNVKFNQNIKALKSAKCGQHFETLVLAKCGLAKCGHETYLAKFGFFLPNAVLAKCGLSKCGHDPPRGRGGGSPGEAGGVAPPHSRRWRGHTPEQNRVDAEVRRNPNNVEADCADQIRKLEQAIEILGKNSPQSAGLILN